MADTGSAPEVVDGQPTSAETQEDARPAVSVSKDEGSTPLASPDGDSPSSPDAAASPAGDGAPNADEASEGAGAGAGAGSGASDAPAEEDIVTAFSTTDLRSTKWQYCTTPDGKGIYVERNNTAGTAKVKLHPSVPVEDGEERVREYQLADVKPRYALEVDEKVETATANLKQAASKKKKSDFAQALAHYGRGIDYLASITQQEMEPVAWASMQKKLLGAYVDLAITSEKYADQVDSAASSPTTTRRVTSTQLRKKCIKFCGFASKMNEDAHIPLAYVRTYYCAAKAHLALSEWQEAMAAARQGLRVPAVSLTTATAKVKKLVESHKKALKQVHEKATAAKKAYNKKGSGFLLAQGAQQESAADGAPAAPGVDTSAAPAATAEATADEAGSTRSPGPSATRSAGRGVLAKSPNPKAKSAHVAFADEAPRQPSPPAETSTARLFAGATIAVGLLALTGWVLVKMGRR